MVRSSTLLLSVAAALAVALTVQSEASVLPGTAADATALAGVAEPARLLQAAVVREEEEDDDESEDESDGEVEEGDSDDESDGEAEEGDSDDETDFFEVEQAPRQGRCVQFSRCGTTTDTKYVKGAYQYTCFKKGEDEAEDCEKATISYVGDGERKKWYKCTCYTGGKVTATFPKMCRDQVDCTFTSDEDDEDDEEED